MFGGALGLTCFCGCFKILRRVDETAQEILCACQFCTHVSAQASSCRVVVEGFVGLSADRKAS